MRCGADTVGGRRGRIGYISPKVTRAVQHKYNSMKDKSKPKGQSSATERMIGRI